MKFIIRDMYYIYRFTWVFNHTVRKSGTPLYESKVSPPKIKPAAGSRFAPHLSRKKMANSLTAKSMPCTPGQPKKCKSTSKVAVGIGATARHVKMLRVRFRAGSPHVPKIPG